jgi:hypothetical protein
MVLENYVKLEPGVRKRLHFYDHTFVSKTITDPLLKRPKTVRALILFCDEEDGVKVDKPFSVIQEKLAMLFAPYLEGKRYKDYTFAITKIGAGFTAEFEVEAIPRA